MTPTDFLAVVLPETGNGFYCVAELSTPKKEHFFLKTLPEVWQCAKRLSDEGKNAYFALSSFDRLNSRKADNATKTRSLYVDLDVGPGKPYVDQESAIAGLAEFVRDCGLPAPMVVSSGYGIHVYWPYKNSVDARIGQTLGNRFKQLALEYGSPSGVKLHLDTAVTGNAAAVLRPPGTSNYKREPAVHVELLEPGDGAVDFAVLERRVAELEPETAAVPDFFSALERHGASGNFPASAVKALVSAQTSVKFQDIIELPLERGCKQIQHYILNAEEDGTEPLWRAVLSIAKYCSDSDRATKWVTKLHPYEESRMYEKLHQIKGPYSCGKFDSANPNVCKGCAHFGRVTNPLALGRKTMFSEGEKTLEETASVAAQGSQPATAIAQTIVRPPAPKGFAYGSVAGIYCITEADDGNGNKKSVNSLILPYDFFPVNLLVNHEKKHIVSFVAYRNGKFEPIAVPQRLVVAKDDTLKTLSEQNIIANNGQDIALWKYVRACVEAASFNTKPVRIPANCGWQEDDTFVFDNRIFTPTEERLLPMPGLENIFHNSKPTGTLEDWRGSWDMLAARGEYGILAMAMVGFGSPLMRFTGLYGMTFHLGSTESGTGKTLAIELAASIWGDPVRSRVTVDTSSIATLNRLGLLGSLPLCTDEITAKNRNDFEWLPGFLFSVTEGHGKDRMESGANKERINTTNWQSLVMMSSNTHVMDYLTGARKHSSEGEVRRILELALTKPMQLDEYAVDQIKALRKNYAVAGEAYVRWLVRNVDKAEAVVRKVYRELYVEFQASSDERFWMAGVAAVVAGCILASDAYAGIVNVPYKEIVEVMRAMVAHARQQAKSSVRTAVDVLNAYVRTNYGKCIVIRKAGKTARAALGAQEFDDSLTRSEIAARVEHDESGLVRVYVEEKILKSFCAAQSFGYNDFIQKIGHTHGVKRMQKNMLTGTRAPILTAWVVELTAKNQGQFDFDEEYRMAVGQN